jgi:hypothetical protein
VVLPLKKESGMIYRARLIGFNETKARKACEELKKGDFSCVAVPSGGRATTARTAEGAM